MQGGYTNFTRTFDVKLNPRGTAGRLHAFARLPCTGPVALPFSSTRRAGDCLGLHL